MTVYVHGQWSNEHPVVLVHGAGGDHTSWRFQTRWLAGRGYRVIAPDLPGHGASTGRPGRTIEDAGRWLADFLGDECGRASLFGYSMGAFLALEVAANNPDLVDRLVLVGAGRRMKVHPQLLDAARHDRDRAAALMAGWMFPHAHAGGHPEPGTWQRGAVERLIARSRPGVLATDLEACAAYDAAPAAAQVVAPTLVVSGSHDRMTGRRGAEELAELTGGAGLVTVEGAGHEPMAQFPARFNALLARFLESRPGEAGR